MHIYLKALEPCDRNLTLFNNAYVDQERV